MVYASDPDAAGDEGFVPGTPAHLVAGTDARLRDPRRTPVRVLGVEEARAMFTVEVLAFEDAGARWEVPVEEAGRFQFPLGGPVATGTDAAALEALARRFDRPLQVAAPAAARERTLRRVAAERPAVARELDAAGVPTRLDPAPCVAARRGDPALAQAVGGVLAARGLADMDAAFAARYVSNPWSGELVKGHAIVAAELGLAPFLGTAVRDPGLFAGAWSRERRAAHLVTRLALGAELWERAGVTEVLLHRGASSETALDFGRRPSFVAATFSAEVAAAHYAGGPPTRAAALHRQFVPVARILLSFWETPALNAPYAEAEALLLGAADGLF